MLSFGIRFGQGFDRSSIIKVMQSVPIEFEYEFLIVGCNPGGVACAREASLAGKKTGIIKWKQLSPAEEKGFDENLKEMADVLEVPFPPSYSVTPKITISSYSNSTFTNSLLKTKNKYKSSIAKSTTNFSKTFSVSKASREPDKNEKSVRKVRRSRLDLNNELFKRGHQARKLMQNAAILKSVVKIARNCGWRVSSVFESLNWKKMTELVMDYVMEKNWKLMALLKNENIEIIECEDVMFIDNHTIKIMRNDTGEQEITADIICVAPSAEYVFPEDVKGAIEFGINCDDFIRMSEPPKKTLVVGSRPEGLECAGIVTCSGFPVTVVSRSRLLKGYDTEMSQLIIEDLKKRGVLFLEFTILTSIEMIPSNKLLAKFISSDYINTEKEKEDEFDTIIFATGRKITTDFLKLKNAGIETHPIYEKILTDQFETTSMPNIYAVGDVVAFQPEGFEISELAGKLLGKRLFHNDTEIMNYSMYPSVIYTPTEYGFVGISEDAALTRLGENCIEIYNGFFTPLEYVLSGNKQQCFAKIIVLKSNDLIAGLHIFGPEAGEVVQGFAAALKTGLTLRQLQNVVGVHSTKAQEILKLKKLKSHKSKMTFSSSYIN